MATSDPLQQRSSSIPARVSHDTYHEMRYIAATDTFLAQGTVRTVRELIDLAWLTFKAHHPEIDVQLQRADVPVLASGNEQRR